MKKLTFGSNITQIVLKIFTETLCLWRCHSECKYFIYGRLNMSSAPFSFSLRFISLSPSLTYAQTLSYEDMFKNRLLSLSVCTWLSFTEHSHRTRGSGNSLRPFCPSSRPGMLSLTNRAPLAWNSLPASIKQAQTMNFSNQSISSTFPVFRTPLSNLN